MRFPSSAHWNQFFKILSRREKASFFVFLFLAIASLLVLAAVFYQKNTVSAPADNGEYAEGVVGRPRFLNPLYAVSYGTDQDISELVYASLLKYDQNGQIVPGLADYKISEDGKTYEFFLKDDLKWSDGESITSDDAIYTIKTIQDKAYASPLRPRWISVETEKVSETSFRLKLQTPNAAFLETSMLKIIPRHIWEKNSAEDFALSPFNLNPVGSGPYNVAKINYGENNAVKSIELERNPGFYGEKPHLRRMIFAFFDNYDALTAAFKQGKIQGFLPREETASNGSPAGTVLYNYTMPRYFAIFFNPEKNGVFVDEKVREALSRATDKNEILEKAINNDGAIADSAILYDIYGINPPETVYGYNPEEAAQILDDAGYKPDENGIRAKIEDRQPAFQFTKTLAKGSNLSAEIKELQKCLVKEVMSDLDTNGVFGPQTLEAVNLFQEKYRADILDPQNIEKPTGQVKQGTRDKLNEVCFPSGQTTSRTEIILTIADQEPFLSVARIIREQWQKIGITVEIEKIDVTEIERDIVKTRDYEALLYGQSLRMIPDIYPYWHSSQKIDPGLNLALYENEEVDRLLEEIRASLDANERAQKIGEVQNIIVRDAPAIFLYNPNYGHIVSKTVKGVTGGVIVAPSQRFSDIAEWYTATKRIWKR